MTYFVSTHLIHIVGGQQLLIRRAGTKYFPGFLSCVAGHVEETETPAEALVREVKEEVGLNLVLSDLTFRNVIYRILPDRTYVDFFFSIETFQGTPAILEPDKITEIGYFDLNAVEQETVPYIVTALRTTEPYLHFKEL
ncbi:MAG: NUDIX domain-containing protein [Magnetovibrio sp.]|nr:NUDIX domain-containing protein [Magnetovibrio sp.]